MTEPGAIWQRDWAVPPGEILLETLQERGLSQSDLARRMGRPIKTINEIVNAKTAITPETAIQLERTLGITATFWNSLEATYREHLARECAAADLEESGDWVQAFPITDLVQHGLIEAGSTAAETAGALLAYFGVGTQSAWESHWGEPVAAFRESQAFTSSPQAVAAWLRWGELAAADVDTPTFAQPQLRVALEQCRRLTRVAPFSDAIANAQGLLADAGVALVLTPEFSGTCLSGAARWLTSHKAIVQLSLRHKTDDHFWFSLFHEGGHLMGSVQDNFIDEDDAPTDETDETEAAANEFARNALIPPERYTSFSATATFTSQSVRAFARELGIAPGIVVGRLQHDGVLPHSHLNDLKKRIRWPDPAHENG